MLIYLLIGLFLGLCYSAYVSWLYGYYKHVLGEDCDFVQDGRRIKNNRDLIWFCIEVTIFSALVFPFAVIALVVSRFPQLFCKK